MVGKSNNGYFFDMYRKLMNFEWIFFYCDNVKKDKEILFRCEIIWYKVYIIDYYY